MISIKDFLITGSLEHQAMAEDLANLGSALFPLMLILAVIWEQFTEMNFNRLIKSAFVSFMLGVYGSSALKEGVDLSFSISDSLLQNYAQNSMVLAIFEENIQEAKPEVRKEISQEDIDKYLIRKTGPEGDTTLSKSGGMTWKNLTSAANKAVLHAYGGVLILLSYFVLLLISNFYTIGYYFLLVLIPFLSPISLFQPYSSARFGILTSISWCYLTPIFSAVLICLMSQISGLANKSELPDLSTFRMMVQYLVYLAILLVVPYVASAVISYKGVSAIGENLSNSASTATLSAGQNFLMAKASGGIGLGLMALNRGAGELKSLINRSPYDSPVWQLDDLFKKIPSSNLTNPGNGIKISQAETKSMNIPKESFETLAKRYSAGIASQRAGSESGNHLKTLFKEDTSSYLMSPEPKSYKAPEPKKMPSRSVTDGLDYSQIRKRQQRPVGVKSLLKSRPELVSFNEPLKVDSNRYNNKSNYLKRGGYRVQRGRYQVRSH